MLRGPSRRYMQSKAGSDRLVTGLCEQVAVYIGAGRRRGSRGGDVREQSAFDFDGMFGTWDLEVLAARMY